MCLTITELFIYLQKWISINAQSVCTFHPGLCIYDMIWQKVDNSEVKKSFAIRGSGNHLDMKCVYHFLYSIFWAALWELLTTLCPTNDDNASYDRVYECCTGRYAAKCPIPSSKWPLGRDVLDYVNGFYIPTAMTRNNTLRQIKWSPFCIWHFKIYLPQRKLQFQIEYHCDTFLGGHLTIIWQWFR